MKPAPFLYHAPTTVEEVTGLLADLDDAKVLAGGQSLVPMLNLRLTRFEALVDVNRVSQLGTMERTTTGMRVGAMVRQCEIEGSTMLAAQVPLLAQATQHIGHFQIRSRGTLGGSLAHADPAAEYPAVAVALDAEMEIAGPGGTRRQASSDFFAGTWMTTLEADELLVAAHFPAWAPGAGFAVEEVARREGDFALAGAAVGIQVDQGTIARAAIGLFGLASTPMRATAAESALTGATAAAVDVEAIGRAAVEDLDPPGDLHASGALRSRIGVTVVRRAVTRALADASRDTARD